MDVDTAYKYLIRRVLDNGVMRDNRTDIRSLSTFGGQVEIDISEHPAAITLKKLYFKSVIAELVWFIKGDTNVRHLNCKIWNDNSTREFLDSRGLNYPDGFIGPAYGWQWRRSGAAYELTHTAEGIDQLANVIDTLKYNPESRRIIMCSWIPRDVPKMALPPCHALVQFYSIDGKLSAHLYQRSADVFLGVPFNLLSYSLLVSIIANITGLKPDKLVVSYGDLHLYENSIEQAKSLLERESKPFCRVSVATKNIDNIKEDDIKIIDYESYPPIKVKMAV